MQPTRANRPAVAGHVEQPMPILHDNVQGAHDILLADMDWVYPISARSALASVVRHRRDVGLARYGAPLQPHNGRDTLADALDESVDLAVYLLTAIREGVGPSLDLDQMYRQAVQMSADLALAVQGYPEEDDHSDG